MNRSTKWQGKRWGTLGDSITAANVYQPIVSEALGFATVRNYGKSGCPVTNGVFSQSLFDRL